VCYTTLTIKPSKHFSAPQSLGVLLSLGIAGPCTPNEFFNDDRPHGFHLEAAWDAWSKVLT